VNVTRNKLSEGVGNGDNGLAKITVLHSGSAPKTACSGHIATVR
jgi:hypothetical protein